MLHKIIQLQAFKVYGIPIKISHSQNLNYKIISEHWKFFNKELWQVKTDKSQNWVKYGITYKESDDYYYMPGIPINGEKSFHSYEINLGNYAIFTHKGNMSGIKNTLNTIYKIEIPKNTLNINKNRSLIHFEKYDNRFNWNRPNSEFDIYIPLI